MLLGHMGRYVHYECLLPPNAKHILEADDLESVFRNVFRNVFRECVLLVKQVSNM